MVKLEAILPAGTPGLLLLIPQLESHVNDRYVLVVSDRPYATDAYLQIHVKLFR